MRYYQCASIALVALLAGASVPSSSAVAASDSLPNWRPFQLCADSSGRRACRRSERQARRALRRLWHSIPSIEREHCVKASWVSSYKALASCIKHNRGDRVVNDFDRDRDPARLRKLTRERNELNAENTDLRNRIRRLIDERNAFRDQVNRSVQDTETEDALQERIERLRRRVRGISSSRDEYQALALARQKTIEGLKADRVRFDDLSQTNATLRNRVKELLAERDERQTLVADHATTIEELDALRRRNKRLSKRFSTVTAARDEYQTLATERNREIARLKEINLQLRERTNRLSSAEQNYNSELSKHQLIVDRLTNRFSGANTRIASLEESLADARQSSRTGLAQCQRKLNRCTSTQATVREAAARACETRLARIVRNGRILFASGSAEIEPGSFNTLNQLSRAIKRCDDMTVVVEGHTDSQGAADFNLKLSEDRAASVLAYLARKDVDRSQLRSIGYGVTRPVADNTTEDGRQANRRIQFSIR